MSGYLICTDLDRTLIPNGDAPEDPRARPLFRRLVARPDVQLAYVTGRHLALVEDAIAEWDLPGPDFIVADVGTTVHLREGGGWTGDATWRGAIAVDWGGRTGPQLHALLADVPDLVLQAEDRQAPFKLSYEIAGTERPEPALTAIRNRLAAADVRANVVWSVDSQAGCGLIDVLPAGAGKLPAIGHVVRITGCPAGSVVFAGDSGNDLDVILGPVPAVLVANADATARRCVDALGERPDILLARGGFLGLNGNYAAGILEGVAHYLPELGAFLAEVADEV